MSDRRPADQRQRVLQEGLRKRGYRLTPARNTILRTLARSGGHLTADDLAALVREQAPGVGRMTVYRTLEILQQMGLVQPIFQGTGAAHYVLIEDGHHHHLICSMCNRIIEFDECVAQEIGEVLSRRFDFQIHSHMVEFYGLCAQCRESQVAA
jgi:Fur family ferric uptake transcriptional regulator